MGSWATPHNEITSIPLVLPQEAGWRKEEIEPQTSTGQVLQQLSSGMGKFYTKWVLRIFKFSEILDFRTEDMRLDLSQKTQQGIVNKNAIFANLHQDFPSWPSLFISFVKKHCILDEFRLTESTRVKEFPYTFAHIPTH